VKQYQNPDGLIRLIIVSEDVRIFENSHCSNAWSTIRDQSLVKAVGENGFLGTDEVSEGFGRST
jgi:hypothetical protein